MKIKGFTQKDRYGNSISMEFFEDNSIPTIMAIPEYDHPGDPKGTDTVPAWLTPGEYVINAEATRKYEPLLEEINEEGKEMQAAQGGSVPTYVFNGGMINNLSSLYRAEGGSTPSWLTDELLDSIMQVESGGDVKAESPAGALGPYQIMPSTAAQPGYGVTPLSQEELTDPVKSREFARSYLAGIAANNPNYTMEEVLQAYNAGPGRIAKFKAGEGDPLTQETVEYPTKVMANLQTKEEPGVVDRILSMLNPISTAEAAVPPTKQAPPAPTGATGSGAYLPDAAANKTANIENLKNQGDYGVNDRIIRDGKVYVWDKKKQAYFDKEGVEYYRGPGEYIADKAGEFISEITEPPPSAAGVGDTIVGLWDGQDVYKDKDTGEFYVLHGRGSIRGGLLPWQLDDIEFKDKDQRITVPEPEPNPEIASKPLVPAPGTETLVPDIKQKPITPEAKDTANKVSKTASEGSTTGSPSNTPETEAEMLKRLGYQKDKNGNLVKLGEGDPKADDYVETAKGWFTEMFADMFSGKELARMALMYAGSRLMGYDHGGSLNFSMKQYIERVDDDIAAREKFVTNKDNLENYTKKSLALYRKTGNLTDLEEKAGGTSIMSEEGFAYIRGYGEVPKVKLSDKSEAVLIDGKPIRINNPAIAGRIEPYNKEMQGKFVVADRFAKNVEQAVDVINQGIDEKQQVKLNPSSIGTQAASLIDKVLIQNGVSIRDAYETEKAMQDAIADFVQANADFKAGRTKIKPYSLEQYFNKQVLTPLTDISQDTIGNTTPKNLGELDSLVRKGMNDKYRGKNGHRVPGYQEEYFNEWQAIYRAWGKLGPEGRAAQTGKTPEGWSDFTYWAFKTPPSEIEKLLKK